MKISELLNLINSEDMQIEVLESPCEGFFSFWLADYFSGELSKIENDYIKSLDVKGIEIYQNFREPILQILVEMPKAKNDPVFTEILKNIYGEEFYNEIHND